MSVFRKTVTHLEADEFKYTHSVQVTTFMTRSSFKCVNGKIYFSFIQYLIRRFCNDRWKPKNLLSCSCLENVIGENDAID